MAAEDVSEVVSRVAATKNEWASLAPARKLELIDLLLDALYANVDSLQNASMEKRDGPPEAAPAYVALSKHEAKTLQHASKASHYMHSAMLISNWLACIREYYDSVVKTGTPPSPLAVRELPAVKGEPQRFAVKVGPKGLLHTTLVTYGSMELIVEGPVEQELLHEQPAGVTAVLGAGNFDGPVDLLTSLFIENKVCIYKASPMNALLLEPLKKIFAPLIEHNYTAIIIGDVAEANALLSHPEVEKWYMTGAAATAYRIIWGRPTPPSPPAEPLLAKPMTVELGNCTPWIVCPGDWRAIAAAMVFNGAHICVHPQVLITCKSWPQRDEFLRLIRTYVKETHYVGCYYPVYKERMESARNQLMKLGKKPEDFEIPVKCPIAKDTNIRSIIFATDLPQDCFLTQQETFSPCCGEVPLETENEVESFLDAAVKCANEGIHGGLSISISVKTHTPEQEKLQTERHKERRKEEKRTQQQFKGSTLIRLDAGFGSSSVCAAVWRGAHQHRHQTEHRLPLFGMGRMPRFIDLRIEFGDRIYWELLRIQTASQVRRQSASPQLHSHALGRPYKGKRSKAREVVAAHNACDDSEEKHFYLAVPRKRAIVPFFYLFRLLPFERRKRAKRIHSQIAASAHAAEFILCC
ncbi:hypothetical protein Efla_000924 [Eimeria flavescens]